MQTLTAKEFSNQSVLGDLKEVCGEHFELISPQLRLTVLATLTQFQLLKKLELAYFTWEMMEEAADNLPALAWLGHREIKERLLRCWQLDDDAIAHLIQQLAENL